MVPRGQLLDGDRLDRLLVERVRPLLPPGPIDGSGLIPSLAESWTDEDSLSEGLSFLCERFLDEIQDDIMIDTTDIWPTTQSGEIASPYVEVDTLERVVRLGFVAGDERIDLEPIRFAELS
jgi:hypothetical protein